MSEVLQKAVVKHGLLGCEGGPESQPGRKDNGNLEAERMAGDADLGTPACEYEAFDEEDRDGATPSKSREGFMLV